MSQQIGGEKMRELADMLSAKLKGLGFCLIVFPFNETDGMANYVSNAQREDMILFLYETLESLLDESDFMTPNEN